MNHSTKTIMANTTFLADVKMCYSNGNSYSFVLKFPSSIAFAIHLFACILSGLILLTTICLNSLTVLTFWRTPRLRKNASLYLVMILSFVDAGVGVSCNPFLTIGIIYDLKHSSACWVYDIQIKLLRTFTFLSLTVVAAISVERYFGVVHPLIHRTKLTKVKLSQLLLFIWSSCGIVSLPAYFDDNPVPKFAHISIAFLILITVCSYTKIAYVVIRSKIRRERLTENQQNAEGGDNQPMRKTREEILHFLKELKMTKSCFLIVFCYLLCYTPIFFLFAVLRTKLSPFTKFYVRPWCLLFVMLNSTLNSIFFWRSASLRSEAKNVLKIIKVRCFSF